MNTLSHQMDDCRQTSRPCSQMQSSRDTLVASAQYPEARLRDCAIRQGKPSAEQNTYHCSRFHLRCQSNTYQISEWHIASCRHRSNTISTRTFPPLIPFELGRGIRTVEKASKDVERGAGGSKSQATPRRRGGTRQQEALPLHPR